MNAIVTPMPQPTPPPEVTEVVAEPERTRRVVRPLAAIVLIAVLAAATLVAWERVGGSERALPSADPLAENLAWMFDAALTYPGSQRTGELAEAPFVDISIDSITIVDATSGPIVAVGSATRPDGSTEPVAYHLEVVRVGDGWSVAATRVQPASNTG